MHVVCVGGSDAGISAALRAREVDPDAEVTVVVADSFPNFSICGIPYYVSGDVGDWRHLAHRSTAELSSTGIALRLETRARRIDAAARELAVTGPDGAGEVLTYDALVVATGALPVRPAIEGLAGPGALGPGDGVHLLHSMADTFDVMRTLAERRPASAVIVGAGYIGLEMAEALTARGLAVTQVEQRQEVLPTVDAELGILVRRQLCDHGVSVRTGTAVRRVARAAGGDGRLSISARGPDGDDVTLLADMVLVVAGVRPDTELAAGAGARLGTRGALVVDRAMRTDLPGVFAAGDCVVTHHRLLGPTYLPLGTTAHKQGRVAGENAVGGQREFAGSLGTQVVKVFDTVAARTGVRDTEARSVGIEPLTVAFEGDDHKAYYPGAHRVQARCTGDMRTGRLVGVQLFGHLGAAVAKRIDVAAAAIFSEVAVDAVSDLDLSYTPPLGSPWDLVQGSAQAWVREARRPGVRAGPPR